MHVVGENYKVDGMGDPIIGMLLSLITSQHIDKIVIKQIKERRLDPANTLHVEGTMIVTINGRTESFTFEFLVNGLWHLVGKTGELDYDDYEEFLLEFKDCCTGV
jgi:hypothetical protein